MSRKSLGGVGNRLRTIALCPGMPGIAWNCLELPGESQNFFLGLMNYHAQIHTAGHDIVFCPFLEDDTSTGVTFLRFTITAGAPTHSDGTLSPMIPTLHPRNCPSRPTAAADNALRVAETMEALGAVGREISERPLWALLSRCVEYAFSVTVPGRFSSPPFSPPG